MCRHVIDDAFIQRVLPGYAHLLQQRQEEMEGIRIWLPSIQRFIRLPSFVNNQRSLRELVVALDQQLLVLHGFDVLATNPLFGLRMDTQFTQDEDLIPNTPLDFLVPQ